MKNDAGLPPPYFDKLYAQGVSSEHAEVLAKQEAKALAGAARGPDAELRLVREHTLRFVAALVDMMLLPPAGRFNAVRLLDLYHSRGGGGDRPVATLPAACAAAVSLVGKGEDSTFAFFGRLYPTLAVESSRFARWLEEVASEAVRWPLEEVASEDVLSEEWKMLELLEWQLMPPSVHTWLTVLCERFSVLSSDAFRRAVDWVQKWTLTISWTLLNCQGGGAGLEISPRRVAQGLFCLGLVSAGELPAATLRPHGVRPEDWEALLRQGRNKIDFPCGLAPDSPEGRTAREQILCTLQITAGCRLPELQEHAHVVALAMKSAVEELMRRQQERLQQEPQPHQQRASAVSRRRKENCSENTGVLPTSACKSDRHYFSPTPLGEGGKCQNRAQPESEPEVGKSSAGGESGPPSPPGEPEPSPEPFVFGRA